MSRGSCPRRLRVRFGARARGLLLAMGLLAGAAPPAAASTLPWRLVGDGSFMATQFRLAPLLDSATPEFLAFGRESVGEGQSSVLLFSLEAPQYPCWQWNFPLYEGGLAASGDVDGDGVDELVFWRHDPERGRLGFHVERLRRGAAGVLASDTLLTCAGVEAGASGSGPEQVPRASSEGSILQPEGRIVVGLLSGFNWRLATRGLLIHDLQGTLLHRVELPNNSFAYRFADLDGDGRRELFLSSYASGNGCRCARGDDGHSYWRVLDLDGRDRLAVEAGGFATLAATQPLQAAPGAPPQVLASLSRSQADALRIYDAAGELLRVRPLPAALTGPPLIADLNADGVDEILVGLADGSLLTFDATFQEMSRHHFGSAVQPLCVADLAGDLRSELLLRIGDELLVCDRELAPLATWEGSLTERLLAPADQVRIWRGADGLPRLAVAGLLPGKVGLLRLEPAMASPALEAAAAESARAGGRLQVTLLSGLLALAGLAVLGLLLGRRRLLERLEALTGSEGAPPGCARTDEEAWRRLHDGLVGFSHRSKLLPALSGLGSCIDQLLAADTVENRRELRGAVAELRAWLPELLGLAPHARGLLGEDPEAEQLFAETLGLLADLTAFAASEQPRDFLLERAESIRAHYRELPKLTEGLLVRVRPHALKPVIEELLDLLPALRRRAAGAGTEIELDLAGPLDTRRFNAKCSEFADAFQGLLEIGLSRVTDGPPPPLRFELRIEGEELRLAVLSPGRRDGADTVRLWAAFVERQHVLFHPRRAGDLARLRLPLLRAEAGHPRTASAGGGLLALLALLCLAPGPRAAEGADYHFEELASIRFDPAATAQLLCADLDGEGADNAVLLLREGGGPATWLLVQRQVGRAALDSIPLPADRRWRLVGSQDLDGDGHRELLLSAWRADSLELHALELGPGTAAARRLRSLLALGLCVSPAPGCPEPHFAGLRALPDDTGFALAYPRCGLGRPSGLVALGPRGELLWQREFPGPLRVEDQGDLNGDGRAELLLAVGTGHADRGPAAQCAAVDLDAAGRTLQQEACGAPGSTLHRRLLKRDGEALGEARLIDPGRGPGAGTQVEFHPAGAASLRLLRPSWKCLDHAVLDVDGDGRDDLMLATGGDDPAHGGLVALDAELEEIARRALTKRPQALLAGDFADQGIDQLLVAVPGGLSLVGRNLATVLASLDLPPCGFQEPQPIRLRVDGKLRQGLALLGGGQLAFVVVEPGGETGPSRRLAAIGVAGLLGLGLGLGLPRLRGGARRGRTRALDWRLRANLLVLLLDWRCRNGGAERLAALGERCRSAAEGEGTAEAAAALATLQAPLGAMLRAWPRGLDPPGRRCLQAALDQASRPLQPPEWRRLADALRRLESRLCSLEERLAWDLSTDPAGAFQGALARCLRGRAALEAVEGLMVGGHTAPVLFEPDQLGVVLENLIANALRGMENSPSRRLRLELRPEGDELHLLLEDSGRGVDAGMEEEIFRRGVTTKRGEGGDGLAICRDLVTACGGRIACLPGRGSLGGARFELVLRTLGKLA